MKYGLASIASYIVIVFSIVSMQNEKQSEIFTTLLTFEPQGRTRKIP